MTACAVDWPGLELLAAGCSGSRALPCAWSGTTDHTRRTSATSSTLPCSCPVSFQRQRPRLGFPRPTRLHALSLGASSRRRNVRPPLHTVVPIHARFPLLPNMAPPAHSNQHKPSFPPPTSTAISNLILRRIPNSAALTRDQVKRTKRLSGTVVKVGDADGFRLVRVLSWFFPFPCFANPIFSICCMYTF